MDWLGTGMVIVAIGAAFISLWRVCKLKKEVLRFTEQVERGLDDIISGKGFPEGVESEKDTLWGAVSAVSLCKFAGNGVKRPSRK